MTGTLYLCATPIGNLVGIRVSCSQIFTVDIGMIPFFEK